MTARTKKKQAPMPGFDGALIEVANVRLSATRSEKRGFRCRPGTFEWRYGRENAESALYHAGIKFADLWEKAGTASAKSVNWLNEGHSDWKGMPDGRVNAMEQINAARLDIGRWATARLVDYCVMGTSASDMASKYGKDGREMAFVIHEDLTAAARHFRFL